MLSLMSNIILLGDSCEWAVVIYAEDGEDSSEVEDKTEFVGETDLCNQLETFRNSHGESQVVHCERAPDSRPAVRRRFRLYNSSSPAYDNLSQEDSTAVRKNNETLRAWLRRKRSGVYSLPKTALYRELLPLLPRYRRIFLLDEDILLHNFGADASCTSLPPVL